MNKLCMEDNLYTHLPEFGKMRNNKNEIKI